MTRLTALILLLLLPVSAGAQLEPAPTLVPPTPVPWPTATAPAEAQESAVARILRDGKVRVGILFNAPPFGLLNIRGDVSGMEADIARSMAEVWGVDLEFVQVTRQSAEELLRSGAVDYLAAALVKSQEERRRLEFCQSHYRGAQALMLRQEDDSESLAQMSGRALGVVAGARAEGALTRWQALGGHRVSIRRYYTLEHARQALLEGEIDGLVDTRLTLRGSVLPGRLRLLDEVLELEAHALAVRPGDSAMRDLINRSLQFLVVNGRLLEIHDANFPGGRLPHDQIPVWQGLGEAAPQPAAFAQPVAQPAQNAVVARLESGEALRVAGLEAAPQDAAPRERRLADWREALAQQLALRLGTALQPVEGPPLELLAAGEADLAVGTAHDWAWADQVDFSVPLLLHGERLLVPAASEIVDFQDLDKRILGVLNSEAGSTARAEALAERAGASVELFSVRRDQDVEWHLLVEREVDAVFGDSLRLMAPLQERPGWTKLAPGCPGCDPWLTRSWRGVALPKHEPEFRRLVDAALGAMARDGSLAQLLAPLMPGQAIADLLLHSGF